MSKCEHNRVYAEDRHSDTLYCVDCGEDVLDEIKAENADLRAENDRLRKVAEAAEKVIGKECMRRIDVSECNCVSYDIALCRAVKEWKGGGVDE